MADVSELRLMVKSFRVTELVTLLNFAGRDKHGKKSELKDRALALCTRNCSPSISIKIHELNKKRLGISPTVASSNASANFNSGPAAAAGTRTQPSSGTIPEAAARQSASATSNRLSAPLQAASASYLPLEPSTSSYGMTGGSRGYIGGGSAGVTSVGHSLIPVHPDVRLKRLPFYDYIAELLKTSSLPVRGMSRVQESSFSFHFTPQQAREINRSRYMANEMIEEFAQQVLLRFCLAETTCEQQDNFPASICVRVNNKLAQLPATIPSNKQGVEPKRPGRPVDITHNCKLVATEANQIDISWATDNIQNYCVTVTLEQRLDSDILMSRLKHKGLKHPDHTRALIKEKLASNSDNEIATTSLRVSLICPLGKMRMSVPTRSSSCSHLQCFDATTFIHMNEKKSSWLCPICDRPAEFRDLFIDGLFTEILSKTSDTNEIEFSATGSWSPFHVKTDECRIDDSVLVHSLDDDGEENTSAVGGAVSGDCIDLTETDDDEPMMSSGPPRPPSAAGSCKSSYSLSSDSTIIGSMEYTAESALEALFGPSYGADANLPDNQQMPQMSTIEPPETLRADSPLGMSVDLPPPLSPYWTEDWDGRQRKLTDLSNAKSSTSTGPSAVPNNYAAEGDERLGKRDATKNDTDRPTASKQAVSSVELSSPSSPSLPSHSPPASRPSTPTYSYAGSTFTAEASSSSSSSSSSPAGSEQLDDLNTPDVISIDSE